VHVTAPEAQLLMNKEHVRLLKLYQHQMETFTTVTSKTALDINLSFLHPVSTLIITIRNTNDLTQDETGTFSTQKGHFFYHGDGQNPNYDRAQLEFVTGSVNEVVDPTDAARSTVKLTSIGLTLNGQERHAGMDKGLPVDYLQARLLPLLHSNSNVNEKVLSATLSDVPELKAAGSQLYQLSGSKNIYAYPFALNPEGTNPSGAVNFSKVSHAKLRLHLEKFAGTPGTNVKEGIGNTMGGDDYRVDVYALYYNWLQIKDGRALLSFA